MQVLKSFWAIHFSMTTLNMPFHLKQTIKTLSRALIKSKSAKLQAFHPQKCLFRRRSRMWRRREVILINVAKARHVLNTT